MCIRVHSLSRALGIASIRSFLAHSTPSLGGTLVQIVNSDTECWVPLHPEARFSRSEGAEARGRRPCEDYGVSLLLAPPVST